MGTMSTMMLTCLIQRKKKSEDLNLVVDQNKLSVNEETNDESDHTKEENKNENEIPVEEKSQK